MLVRVILVFVAATSLLMLMSLAPTPAQASQPEGALEGTGLVGPSPATFNSRGFHHEPYLHLTPTFRFEYSSAEISREAPCLPNRNSFASSSIVVPESSTTTSPSATCPAATLATAAFSSFWYWSLLSWCG